MNIIRLLNYLRPYQLRENLIRKLKQQVEQKETMLSEIKTRIMEFNDHISEWHTTLACDTASPEVDSIRQKLEALIQKEEPCKMDEEFVVLLNKHCFITLRRTWESGIYH